MIRKKDVNLYLAAISCNLGMVSTGLYVGWSSPSIPILLAEGSPVRLNLEQSGWVVSLLAFGATFGSLICISVVNIIGRKYSMLFNVVPSLISWLMIALATTPWELYVARSISGFGSGSSYIATTMYLGEISPANVRGKLASLLTVATKFGAFLEFVIGPFLSVRNLAFTSCLLPFLFFITCIRLPESPYHLMRRGRKEDAIKSLMTLRGTTNVSEEAAIIEKTVKLSLARYGKDSELRQILLVPGNRRALITVLGLITVQQWSGNMAIQSYAQLIFDAADTNVEGKYLTIVLGAVQTIASVISALIVDRFGRKPLLMFSCSGAVICTFMIGLYFFLQEKKIDTNGLGWLPASGAFFYIFVYCVGLAGLPFTITSELFPMNIKALGTTLVLMFYNFYAFTVTNWYHYITNYFGIYCVFWVFSTVSVLGLFFVIFYVPETKGKTLQAIQEELNV